MTTEKPVKSPNHSTNTIKHCPLFEDIVMFCDIDEAQAVLYQGFLHKVSQV
ncbi:MAG: hypothetical protein ACI37T_00945 [Candidatus Gastranaerophilaceae bacterium]